MSDDYAAMKGGLKLKGQKIGKKYVTCTRGVICVPLDLRGTARSSDLMLSEFSLLTTLRTLLLYRKKKSKASKEKLEAIAATAVQSGSASTGEKDKKKEMGKALTEA